MNYNKNRFTKEEFALIPIYENVTSAPLDTPFLLWGKMGAQKDVVEKIKTTPVGPRGKKLPVKVTFWKKIKGKKDGDPHVREEGATIDFPEILESDETVEEKNTNA